MTTGEADPPPGDVLDGAAVGRWSRAWSRLTVRQRRLALTGLLLPAAATVLVLGGASLRGWWDERTLRDVVAVEAELGVNASSTAWSPAGRGRVDYFLVLRNSAPRPARLRSVDLVGNGLAVSGRALEADPVRPGGTAYVPLSVALDCRRWRPEVAGAALTGSVGVVASSGRSTRVEVFVRSTAPLVGVARTLCRMRPDLQLRELSGPVSPV